MSPTHSPKQTPTPWIVEDAGVYLWVGYPKAIGRKVSEVVCEFEVGPHLTDAANSRARANAHLIAAAPELYEACDAWIRWLDPETEFSEDDAEIEREILDRMKAALSKARPSNRGEA